MNQGILVKEENLDLQKRKNTKDIYIYKHIYIFKF